MTPAERSAATVAAVAAAVGVPLAELHSRRRHAPLVAKRREVIRVLAERHGWSTTQIGRALGRDHSTIVHHLQIARGAAPPPRTGV